MEDRLSDRALTDCRARPGIRRRGRRPSSSRQPQPRRLRARALPPSRSLAGTLRWRIVQLTGLNRAEPKASRSLRIQGAGGSRAAPVGTRADRSRQSPAASDAAADRYVEARRVGGSAARRECRFRVPTGATPTRFHCRIGRRGEAPAHARESVEMREKQRCAIAARTTGRSGQWFETARIGPYRTTVSLLGRRRGHGGSRAPLLDDTSALAGRHLARAFGRLGHSRAADMLRRPGALAVARHLRLHVAAPPPATLLSPSDRCRPLRWTRMRTRTRTRTRRRVVYRREPDVLSDADARGLMQDIRRRFPRLLARRGWTKRC